MAFMFENQKVYRKAIDFADNICAITSNFPKGYYFLRDQLNRAALSIAELKTAQIENDSERIGHFTSVYLKPPPWELNC